MTMMKYHIMLARNDVFSEWIYSHFPFSLNNFNETCTSVIVKKRSHFWTRYWSQCWYLAQVIRHLKKIFFYREYSENWVLGAFKYLANIFNRFVKKSFCARFYLFLKSTKWFVPVKKSSIHGILCIEKWVAQRYVIEEKVLATNRRYMSIKTFPGLKTVARSTQILT